MSTSPSQLILTASQQLAHSCANLERLAEMYQSLSFTPESEFLLGAMTAIVQSMNGQVATLATTLRMDTSTRKFGESVVSLALQRAPNSKP